MVFRECGASALRPGNEGFVVLEGAQETQLAEGVFPGGAFGKHPFGLGSSFPTFDFFGNAVAVFPRNFTHSIWHSRFSINDRYIFWGVFV